MAEKDRIIKEKVEHFGLFDFKGFYGYAHSWLDDEEGYGVTEEKYSEKVSGNSRDITIEWKATKKLSDYFKIEIKIEFEVKDLTDVEVEIDGKKRKMNKGKVKVEITGNLVKDPESKWDTSPGTRFLRDIYNKYIVPKRIESMEERVESNVKDFKEELKAFLELTGKR